MLDFFISLRKMLIAQTSIDSVAETPIYAIENIFIPKIKELIKQEPEGSRTYDDLSDTLADWNRAKDDRGRWIARVKNALPARLTPSSKENLAGFILEKMWGPKPRRVIEEFDPTKGIDQFRKMWSKMLYNLMKYGVRQLTKGLKDPLERAVGPTEEGKEMLERIETKGIREETELSKQEFAFLAKQLNDYVRPKLDQRGKAVWEVWLKKAIRKGGENVAILDEVVMPLVEEGVGSRSALAERWKGKIIPLILRFFKDELGMPLSKKQKKKMFRKGSESMEQRIQRLAVSHWRRQVAMWMLGPLGTRIGRIHFA